MIFLLLFLALHLHALSYGFVVETRALDVLAYGKIINGNVNFEFIYSPTAEPAILRLIDLAMGAERGRYAGIGALGLPFGIIPCNKYVTVVDEFHKTICLQGDKLIYSVLEGKKIVSKVYLLPTLPNLEMVKIVTKPVAQTTASALIGLSAITVLMTIPVWLKRKEYVVVPP